MIFLKENINEGPLLFIDTIKEDVKPFNQELFDSRKKQETKEVEVVKTKQQDTNFYIKVSRLIEMFNRKKKIICKITLLSFEEYYVIVKELANNELICDLLDNSNTSFNVNQIDELTIEQIN